jgi:hypothetical protein
MSNKVKYFNSALHTGMGTWIPDNANSVLSIIKACLNTGFNSKTVSTITRSGSTATCTTTTTHNYVTGQTLLLESTGITEYNGEFTITVPTGSANTFTFTVTGTPGTANAGTCKVAPLGWDEVYTGTNKSVFRSPNVLSPRAYYRFEDPATITVTRNESMAATNFTGKAVKVEVYDTMSSVDVGNEVQCWGYIQKGRNTANTNPQNIIIVGDDRGFFLFMESENLTAPKYWIPQYFGDWISPSGMDAWCYGMHCRLGIAGATNAMDNTTYISSYMGTLAFSTTVACQLQFARSWNGIYPGEMGVICSMYSGTYLGTSLTYPNPVDQGAYGFPVLVGTSSGGIRGIYPGLLNSGFAPGVNENRQMEIQVRNWNTQEWRKMLVLAVHASSYGAWGVDLTGPWR